MGLGSAKPMVSGRVHFRHVKVGGIYYYAKEIQTPLSWFVSIAVGCPSLEVSNCKVQMDFQGIGAVARFVCLTGYTLEGASTMTCGSGGVWLGKMPTCRRKSQCI